MPTEKINGGFIILARNIVDNAIMEKPVEWRWVWIHILLHVSWKGGNRLKRGEGLFNWESKERHRLKGVSEHQWRKAIIWLRSSQKIATRKATRGMFINVLNYGRYQDMKMYKSQTESHGKARQKPDRSQTKGEEGNESKEGNKTHAAPLAFDTPLYREAWGEWVAYKKEKKEKLTDRSIKMQQKAMKTIGESRAILAIEHSIANNWVGIHEPKGGSHGTVERNPSRVRAEPGKYDNIGETVGENPPEHGR